MLSFFRKYEKTFLLLIFAPALITLGISTAMMDVFRGTGDYTAGTVFGETVPMSEFQRVTDAYGRINQYVDEDMKWKFYALYKAAQRAGLSVTDEEVGERIANQKRFEIARQMALDELAKEGVFQGSPDFNRKFSEKALKYMTGDLPFDRANYGKTIPPGMTIKEYEDHEKREALVSRYLDTLRELATVTPDEVWKEYQDQHHRRTIEVVTVLAKDHAPDVAVVDSDDGRVISDQQVQEYYDLHEEDYTEPRKAKLEFLGLKLDDVSVDEVKVDDAKAYFEVRRADIAGVTSESWDAITDEQRQQVFDMLESERKLERADQVMSAVATRVAAAEAKGEKTPDLAAIEAEVERETGAALERGTTDLLEAAALADHPVLDNAAARFWFSQREPGDTSDVLAGEKAWFVVRSLEVKHERMPPFEEVKERARQDYAAGSKAERKRYYEEHKNQRYMGEPSYRIEALVAKSADYAADGKDGGEAAKKALQTLIDTAAAEGWPRGWDFNKVYTLEKVEKASLIDHLKADAKKDGYTKQELEADPVFGHAAEVIGSFGVGEVPMNPYARKDGQGFIVFRVVERKAPEVRKYDDVEAEVIKDLQAERGLQRAQAWAERLSGELQSKSADEARAHLEKKGLKPQKLGPFGRDEAKLEGFPDAGRIVAAAFESEMKPGGAFTRVIELPVHPDGARAVLLRVAERVDAAQEEFAKKYAALRKDVLNKKKGEYAAAQARQTFLDAKGIGPEHVKYVTALRDGPGGVVRLRVRQLFVPPDRAVVDAWLDEKALAVVRKAQEELRAGKSWELVVDKYSEDEVTRARKGELPPVERGQLGDELGNAFEEAAFGLRDGAISPEPVRSDRGWHLIKRIGDRDKKTVFAHLLIKTTPEARNLPEDVKKKAEDIAKGRAEDALKQLQGGAAFADVAEKLGDIKDPFGQGQPFDMDYVTPFEQAALNQRLEWELAEGKGEAAAWLPDPVELPTGASGAKEWHLFACSRDTYDRGGPGEVEARRDRQVFHIVTPTKDAIDGVRAELQRWIKEKIEKDEDRPGWFAILDKFRALAKEHSKAPDAAKGGSVGVIQLEGSVRAYGDAFFDAVCRRSDGGAAVAGHRTGVFRSEEGWHIVEVLEVVTAEADREGQVADLLLRGTDWK